LKDSGIFQLDRLDQQAVEIGRRFPEVGSPSFKKKKLRTSRELGRIHPKSLTEGC